MINIGRHRSRNLKKNLLQCIEDTIMNKEDLFGVFLCSGISFSINRLSLIIKNNMEYIKEKFKKIICIVHSPYTNNLATSNEKLWHKTRDRVVEELTICNKLGVKYLVIHPNSNKQKEDRKIVIETIISRLNIIFTEYVKNNHSPTTILLLENTAYKKSIGNVNELIYIVNQLKKFQKYVALCLDTCHLFSLETNLNSLKETNMFLYKHDFNLVKLLHLNNSKHDYLSNRDRHESLNSGMIRPEALKYFLHSILNKNSKIDILLETPFITQDDDIKITKKWITEWQKIR